MKVEKSKLITTYFEQGKIFQEQGQITEAIEKYNCILEINSHHPPTLHKLAIIYENIKNFDQSIDYYNRLINVKPDNAIFYARLAKVMIEKGCIEDAILNYQKAIKITTELPAWVYISLGDLLEGKKQIDDAINNYNQAINLYPENSNSWIKLANIYFRQGNIDQVIDTYQKAIRLQPNLSFNVYQNLSFALRSQGRLEEANQVIQSMPTPEHSKIYAQIWETLNQVNLEKIDTQIFPDSTKMNIKEIEGYFNQVSKYKIINLTSLTESDQECINDNSLSLEYLKLNQPININQNKNIKKVLESQNNNCSYKTKHPFTKLLGRTDFQISLVESGKIKAICPFTGKTIYSNHSFFIGGINSYRFLSQEIFYLIIARPLAEKCFLYFPQKELIISLVSDSEPLSNIHQNDRLIQKINFLKTSLVFNWQQTIVYINTHQKKTAVIVDDIPNIGHYLWNYLSGIEKIFQYKQLDNIDKFIITDSQFFGKISDLYLNINNTKIQYIKRPEILQETLKNNYFVIKLGHVTIQENLAKRVSEYSWNKSSSSLKKDIETSKQNFPLIWITIRTDNRSWVNQVEGIANIIQKLAHDFPHLGIVLNGFAQPEHGIVGKQNQLIIEQEKEIAHQIQSLISKDINVYNIIGCMMHESVVWANAVDLYLSPWGASLVTIAGIANKPGIIHTNKQVLRIPILNRCWWLRLEQGESLIPQFIDEKYITDVIQGIKKKALDDYCPTLNNYDCDWQVIYERMLALILSM